MTRFMPPPADKNYFELFGLPASFDLDLTDLAARYRNLAREAHPDRFASGSDVERRLAMQMITQFNEAFRVLRDPIARAHYLLALRGTEVPADTTAAMTPAFLGEQMELREQLEAARRDRDQEQLAQLALAIGQSLRQKENMLRRHLSATAWQPQQALAVAREMQFLDKLRQQIADLETESG